MYLLYVEELKKNLLLMYVHGIKISECPSINCLYSINFLRCIILINYKQHDFYLTK